MSTTRKTAGVVEGSRTSPEKHKDPGARQKARFLQSRYYGESLPQPVFPKHCSKEEKKPLLLVGYTSGRCASFALASGEFLSIGEHLRFLDTFLKLGLHFSGFPASLLCVAFQTVNAAEQEVSFIMYST